MSRLKYWAVELNKLPAIKKRKIIVWGYAIYALLSLLFLIYYLL